MEGTFIISALCLLVGLMVLLGFYVHDCAALQTAADELAMSGALWAGRYMHPEIGEVDYELLKRSGEAAMEAAESQGYARTQERLFIGRVERIRVGQEGFQKEIQVEIQCRFQIWKWDFIQKTEAAAIPLQSNDFPRRKEGGEET